MCLHSTIGCTRVLDICTHYLRLYLPNYRESVSISLVLLKAFASDSIFPACCIWLAPTQGIDRPESEQEVTSFRMTILCTFRVMLLRRVLWEVLVGQRNNCQLPILCLLAPASAVFRHCLKSCIQSQPYLAG